MLLIMWILLNYNCVHIKACMSEQEKDGHCCLDPSSYWLGHLSSGVCRKSPLGDKKKVPNVLENFCCVCTGHWEYCQDLQHKRLSLVWGSCLISWRCWFIYLNSTVPLFYQDRTYVCEPCAVEHLHPPRLWPWFKSSGFHQPLKKLYREQLKYSWRELIPASDFVSGKYLSMCFSLSMC